MRRIYTLLILLLASTACFATHIVGGEIEFRRIQGNSYELSLIIYFDELLGNPQALDQDVDVTLFEKGTNFQINNYNLPLISNIAVNYTNPECASRVNIRTRRLLYRRTISLVPQDYRNAAGYYFVHERCCRNGSIANIVSPGEAGQTFYLEFAPLWQNGQHFINSSPRLFPPLSDFACVGKPFYIDFGGIDDDGDSLVYSLAVPINGCSSTNDPKPRNSPANSCNGIPTPNGFYKRVDFRSGYSLNQMVRGNPALSINTEGFLTLTPSERGTFVFAVVCEEFRNGKRIGWMQREFQMTVIDGCIYDPPTARMLTSISPRKFFSTGDTVRIEPGNGSDICFPVILKDINGTNRFVSRIRPLSPKNSEIYIKGINSARVSTTDSTLIEICFNDCPKQGGLHRIDVLIGDNSCALPLFDTLKLLFNVALPTNAPPLVSALTLSKQSERTCYDTIFVKTGQLVSFDVLAKDPDFGRKLKLSAFAENKNLLDLGIAFPTLLGSDSVKAKFNWLTDCSHLDSLYSPETFIFKFVASDTNICNIQNRDTICVPVHLSLAPQPNEEAFKTLIGSDIIFNSSKNRYEARIEVGKRLNFTGIIQDFDGDTVAIRATGKGFDFEAVGMKFPRAEGIGSANSLFSWQGDCRGLDVENGEFSRDYEVLFIGSEKGNCKEPRSDSVLAVITLVFIPDPNVPPALTLLTINQVGLKRYEINSFVGDTIEFEILGSDADRDSLVLNLQPVGFNLTELNPDFLPSNPTTVPQGNFEIRSFYRLMTKCGMLGAENSSKSYLHRFVLCDVKTCNLKACDTVFFQLNLSDKPQPPFTPFPNVFTPNGDSKNQTFRIDNLPIDNCKDQFRFIEVFNRWGNRVFFSEERNFEWDGGDMSSGIHFYLIQFVNSQYKGTITIIK